MKFAEAIKHILAGKKYTCPELVKCSGGSYKYLYLQAGRLTYSNGSMWDKPDNGYVDSVLWVEYPAEYPIGNFNVGDSVKMAGNDNVLTVINDLDSGLKELYCSKTKTCWKPTSYDKFSKA